MSNTTICILAVIALIVSYPQLLVIASGALLAIFVAAAILYLIIGMFSGLVN